MRQHHTVNGRPAARRRTRRQPGYALLVVLLMFSVFVIFLAMAVPRWKTEIQRDRENMEIDRAHQYVEGIKRYYHKFGSYPPNLERLKETNGIHYLRQTWSDPLTPDGKWKLLQYSDLKNGEVVGGGLGLPGAGGMNRAANGTGNAATGGEGSLAGGSLGMGSSMGGDTTGNNPGGSLFADNETSDAGGDNTTDSATATGTGGNSASTTTAPTSSAGTPSSTSGQNRSGGLFGGTTGPAAGKVFGGAGIVGVASKSKKPAVHAFNRKHRPDQWQFVYNPMHDKSLLGPGVGNGPALGQQIGSQPGTSSGDGQGSGLFGAGTSGTGTSGTGTTPTSGDSGSGSNPGAGLFGDSGSH